MSGPYPLATLAPTISSTGIATLAYEDIYNSLVASFQSIYGSDIYIDPDSQDGQWLAVLAQGYYDCGQAMATVFQSYSPSYAQGVALSNEVLINGLQRNIATYSQATCTVVGTVGSEINNGVAQDGSGNLWNLPYLVTIPGPGSISVTVTAQQEGNIIAPIGAITIINTPQLGWQSITNTTAAVPGNAVETDAQLRVRQAQSTAMAAVGIKESLYSVLGNIIGVGRITIEENATGSTDGNGVPAHSISCVVEGGTVADIATAIALQKPPGIQTYGTTSYTYYDQYGLPSVINFDVLTEVQIYYAITIQPLAGYVDTTGTALQAALAAFTASLDIGEDVYVSQASAVASLAGVGLGQQFYIVDFYLDIVPSPTATSNIAIAYNQAAQCSVANIELTVI